MLKFYDEHGFKNWVTSLRLNLFRNGFGYIWKNQRVHDPVTFLNLYVNRLKDQYLQTWNDTCMNSNKLVLYRQFKPDFVKECYIDMIDLKKFRRCFIAFRSSAHKLMIEKGRHHDIHLQYINCIYCECYIEDEYHFVFVCPLYNDLRMKYFDAYYRENLCYRKFCLLLSSRNETTIRNLAMYLFYAFECRNNVLKDRD